MASRTGTRKYLASKMQAGQGGYISGPQDEKTCSDCAGRNGKFSNQKPPFHPNCRCGVGEK